MKTKKFVHTLMMVSMIMVLLTSALSSASLPVQAQNDSLYEVMFSIPTGENGVHYEGVDVPEALTWGPAALTISTDGTFWIADTAGNGLLHYSPKGEFLGKIDLLGLAVGATDLIVNKDIVLVLDQASQPPKVLRMDLKGNVLGSFELPKGLYIEDGLTGIGLGDNGELLIEREFGAYITQFLDNRGVMSKNITTEGFIHSGKQYSAYISGLASANPKHGEINLAGKKIEINTTNDLGGLQILGFGPNGDFYVIVEELTQNAAIQVDQTIRHYDNEGNLIGIARMPVNVQYTFVAQDLAVGPDGTLYAMLTRPDRVDVVRLSFLEMLTPILPAQPAEISVREGSSIIKNSITACVTRSAMISTAAGYLYNSKYYNTTNIDGVCSGREKPSYLVASGTYSSVPYDWYGFDSVSSFNGYMDPNNNQAGDTNETSETCSKGVDCSGYVSRAWQQTSKYGTWTLADISYQITNDELLYGDILNKSGSHTVLFVNFNGSSGIYDYESTVYGNYDRVVYLTSPWSRFTGYTALRYNNVCP